MALAVVPLVLWRLHDHPSDLGSPPTAPRPAPPPHARPARTAAQCGWPSRPPDAARTKVFLAARRRLRHLRDLDERARRHPLHPGRPRPRHAADDGCGLLALVGIFDIVGTVFSGWLTDRIDPRVLLGVYYTLRGASLLLLPSLFSDDLHVNMLAFILFYGLDWVATVPPTIALCREAFGERAPIVFGWVFASHQIGAAIAAAGAGVVRDQARGLHRRLVRRRRPLLSRPPACRCRSRNGASASAPCSPTGSDHSARVSNRDWPRPPRPGRVGT